MPLQLPEWTPKWVVDFFGSVAIVSKEGTGIPISGVGHEGRVTIPPAKGSRPETNEGHDGFEWSQ